MNIYQFPLFTKWWCLSTTRFPDKSLLHPQNSLILKLQGQKGGGVCLRPFLWLKYSNRGQILSSFAYGFRFLKPFLFHEIILGFVNRIKHPSLNIRILIFSHKICCFMIFLVCSKVVWEKIRFRNQDCMFDLINKIVHEGRKGPILYSKCELIKVLAPICYSSRTFAKNLE